MSTTRPDLATLMPEIYADDPDVGMPPTMEEILSHLAGEMDAEQERVFLDRLALHPESARLAADLAMPENADMADEDLPIPDQETVRASLEAKGLLPRQEEASASGLPDLSGAEKGEAANVAPFSAGKKPKAKKWGVHPGWQWAAILFLAVNLGQVWRSAQSPPKEQPSTDVAAWVLESEDRLRRSGGAEVSVDAPSAGRHVLAMVLADRGDHEGYRVVVVDGLGQERWKEATGPMSKGTFYAQIPADFLETGRYKARLIGVDDGRETELAVFPFRWEGE